MNNTSQFDSKEELYMSWYLDELVNAGTLEGWTFDTKPISLNRPFEIVYTKPMKRVPDKLITKTIIPAKIYTPDFKITWASQKAYDDSPFSMDSKGNTILYTFRTRSNPNKLLSLIETKGSFDQNNMTRLFKQNQAWIYDRYGIYVNLVKIPDFFKKTFTPDRYIYTDKTQKLRAIKYNPIRSIKDYI